MQINKIKWHELPRGKNIHFFTGTQEDWTKKLEENSSAFKLAKLAGVKVLRAYNKNVAKGYSTVRQFNFYFQR